MRFVGFDRLYGVDGEYRTPYMTRLSLGRLRLHIFHRSDADPDCHDHPWDFWTFPLTAYVEEVAIPLVRHVDSQYGTIFSPQRYVTRCQIVPALRWSFRPAEHTHRVIGRHDEELTLVDACGAFVAGGGPVSPRVKDGRIVTIVWLARSRRKWGFLRNRDGNWCWTPWKEYVFGGGKHAPCEPGPGGSA